MLDALRRVPNVRWSAAAEIEHGDEVVAVDTLDPEVVLPTASVGKLLLLATVLDEIEQGRLDGSERLEPADDDRVADSGLLQHLDRQRTSVLDLCRFVGAVSDNLATNVLIRRVGLDRVEATTRQLGLSRCALLDFVRDVRRPADPPFLSTGAAGEWCAFARRLGAGDIVSPWVSAELLRLLRLNTDLSMVAAAFALDPLAHIDGDLGFRLFNKTGTQRGTRADVGGVASTVGERRVVATYAVIARYEDSPRTRRAVLDAMRTVGSRISSALLAA